MSTFINFILASLHWYADGMIISWVVIILFIIEVVYLVKGDRIKAEQLFYLSLIFAIIGFSYGFMLTGLAVSADGIPSADMMKYFLRGLSGSFVPIYLFLLNWLVYKVVIMFKFKTEAK